jgi:hypothetical protein
MVHEVEERPGATKMEEWKLPVVEGLSVVPTETVSYSLHNFITGFKQKAKAEHGSEYVGRGARHIQ